MNPIIAPIKPGSKGPIVINLRDALIFLLSKRPDLFGFPIPGTGQAEAFVAKIKDEATIASFADATAEALRLFQQANKKLKANGNVDKPTAVELNRALKEAGAFSQSTVPGALIRGQVVDAAGHAVRDVEVVAFDRELGSARQRLGGPGGLNFTDADGRFQIAYTPEQFASREGQIAGKPATPDVIFELRQKKELIEKVQLIRLFSGTGESVAREQIVSAEDLALGIEPRQLEEIRLIIPGGEAERDRSEYERLWRAIEPMLPKPAATGLDDTSRERAVCAAALEFNEEKNRDVSFAAREIGWDRERVAEFVAACLLADEIRKNGEFAALCYGLLRNGSPANLPGMPANVKGLLAQKTDLWSEKLKDSRTQNFIPAAALRAQKEFIALLRARRIDQANEPVAPGKASLAKVLSLTSALATDKARIAFLTLQEHHEGSTEDFWTKAVPKELGLKPKQIRDVRATLQFAEMTAFNLPLVRGLRKLAPTLRELARVGPDELAKAVARAPVPDDVLGKDETEKRATYLAGIQASVETVFPTLTVAHFARISDDEELRKASPLLDRFFSSETKHEDESQDFDLRTIPVNRYLKEHGPRLTKGMNDEQRTLFTTQLRRLQRTFNLSESPAQIPKLVALGLDSATRVTRVSEEMHVKSYAGPLGGAEAARRIYRRAASIDGMLEMIHADLWSVNHDVLPRIMQGPATFGLQDNTPPLKDVPTYTELFGSLDLCECQHCRSLYSPAAYLVDLLHFLYVPLLKGAPDLSDERNNDKGFSPLEVLIGGGHLGPNGRPTSILGRRPDLAQIQLTCENTNTRIPNIDLVNEILESFVAQGKATAFNKPPPPPDHILPQPTAEELAANPVPLTPASVKAADNAYQTIQDAVYPFTLPFNLNLETARTYLAHLGVSREALLRAFNRNEDVLDLGPTMAIAAETLLLSPEDFELITQAEFGGKTSTRETDAVKDVFGFVTKTIIQSENVLTTTPALELESPSADPSAPSQVKALQCYLNQRGYSFSKPLDVDGKFGPMTADAVKLLQQTVGVGATAAAGVMDEVTWQAITDQGYHRRIGSKLTVRAEAPRALFLCHVPMFLARTGLTFLELVDLVQTRYLNPDLGRFAHLKELDISLELAAAWVLEDFDINSSTHNEVQTRLTRTLSPGMSLTQVEADFKIWLNARKIRLLNIVVLSAPSGAACDLDQTQILQLDGELLNDGDLSRLAVFIRLRQRLGWTIREMDRAFEILAEGKASVLNFILNLADVKSLQRELDLDPLSLLDLWAERMDTNGDQSSYEKLFRNHSGRRLDPIFELNTARDELLAVATISEHVPGILAGLRISENELNILLEALSLPDVLDLLTLSALNRHAIFAKALGLRIAELVALMNLASAKPLDPAPANPVRPTMDFVELVGKVRASGLDIPVIDFLFRHQGAAAQQVMLPALAKTLRDGLAAIDRDQSFQPDLDGQLTRAKLLIVLPNEKVVDEAIQMINGSRAYRSSGPFTLPTGFAFSDSVAGKVAFFRTTTTLSFTGAMTPAERTALKSDGAGITPAPSKTAYLAAVDDLFAQPRDFVTAEFGAFVDGPWAESQLFALPSRDGQGRPSLFDNTTSKLITLLPDGSIPPTVTAFESVVAKKFNQLLQDKLLPYVRALLKESLIVQTLADTFQLEPEVVSTLLNNASVLTLPANPGKPPLAIPRLVAELSAGDGVVSAEFADASFAAPASKLVDMPLINVSVAVGSLSQRWSGYLMSDHADEVAFHIEANDNVRFWVRGKLLVEEWAATAKPTRTIVVTPAMKLEAGTFYPVTLEHANFTASATVRLKWILGGTTQEQIIPTDNLFTLDVLERLQKICLLLSASALKAPELIHFTDPSSATRLDLVALPRHSAQVYDPNPFEQWLRLCDYVSLRQALPEKKDVRLLDVFTALTPEEAQRRLLGLTDWPIADLGMLIGDQGFRFTPTDWKDAARLLRLRECFAQSKSIGVSIERLLDWSRTVGKLDKTTLPFIAEFWVFTTKDAKHSTTVAREIKDAARAKYDDEKDWLEVAGPLSDALRENRRDALVGYILSLSTVILHGIDTRNKLFEYFLIDVDMSACATTSRIVQATCSVQLFIQRCLLNLENYGSTGPNSKFTVAPGQIDRPRWEWMQQYRVWEANRKVLFYPENYIKPELRDDKTPFFKDLESELLQNELIDPYIENVFQHYLHKLHEVAKLEICGFCQNEGGDTLHVFGRTYNIPHRFFYRRLTRKTEDQSWKDGQWTPWEVIPLDIASVDDGENSGVHLMPVVWNKRLYLFWLLFREVPDAEINLSQPENEAASDWEIKLAWSEYRLGTWRTTLQSKETLLSTPEMADSGPIGSPEVVRIVTQGNFEFEYVDTFFFRQIECFLPYPADHICSVNFSGDSIVFEIAAIYSNRAMSGKKISWTIRDTYKRRVGPGLSFFFDFDSQKKIDWPVKNIAPQTKGARSIGRFVMHLCEERVEALPNPLPVDTDVPNRPFSTKNFFNGLRANTASQQLTLAGGRQILFHSPSMFDVLDYDREIAFEEDTPFVYQDTKNAFLVLRESKEFRGIGPQVPGFRFCLHQHPYICDFIAHSVQGGVDALLAGAIQELAEPPGSLALEYQPNFSLTVEPFPARKVAFDNDPFSIYNWELFFHAPLLIASQLTKNQRFEEAMRWFHFIFNPTTNSSDTSPQRCWNFRPFHETSQADVVSERIENLIKALGSDPNLSDLAQEFNAQISVWIDNPFKPHLIARMRHAAYMKNVVMCYIDNLIAWGDYLFHQDSIESINQATQLYVLAANILGPRPQQTPERETTGPQTFAQLLPLIDKQDDDLSDAWVEGETSFPFSSLAGRGNSSGAPLPGKTRTLYFCIPQNDTLLGYWDTVADRLFKIRHCMNMEGVVRQLPLFQPVIDPNILVAAVAKGIDINSVLNDLSAPLPRYRFSYTLQKALEVCNELKTLGGALLSVLEKRDAENLALLHSGHERTLLNLIKEVKLQQINEAEANQAALEQSLATVKARFDYYDGLIQQGLLAEETEQLNALDSANRSQDDANQTGVLASKLHALPNITIPLGPPGTPSTTVGGSNFGSAVDAIAKSLQGNASASSYDANRAAIVGTQARRNAEWQFQKGIANKEQDQVNKQILAAQIRADVAGKELDNHEKQIENADEIEGFLRNQKYTTQELYSWMEGAISTVFFQCYQLAYDLAKQAERCYRFERGVDSSSFIRFGIWDSARKGLLSGEQLSLQLRQLERAYQDENRREYEITKHVSLLQLDPLALIRLRETGACEFEVPEVLFDLDFPGHYFRRIKTVSLSLPCVAGPYSSVSATLTLLHNNLRKVTTVAGGQYQEKLDEDDSRFIHDYAPMQSIATSSGQNDSGLFELNYRDERYLPFEGAGALSRWRLELPDPKTFSPFDYDTISDVVLHVRYTSRDGGAPLRDAANKSIATILKVAENESLQSRLFSLRHEFPSEWQRFLSAAKENGDHEGTFPILKNRFPFLFQGKKITLQKLDLFAQPQQGTPDMERLAVVQPGETAAIPLTDGAPIGNLLHRTTGGDLGIAVESDPAKANWTLTVAKSDVAKTLKPLRDIVLICHYKVG